MTTRTSIVSDIYNIATKIGLIEGKDFTVWPVSDSPEDWVEVEGAGWRTEMTIGKMTPAAEAFNAYIQKHQESTGFEFHDADRSGIYWRKDDIIVRFM